MSAAATPGPGHNSVAADRLRSIIERVERPEEEKAGLSSDIKDVYAEAKGNGYDAAAIRKLIQLRRQDHAERQERQAILQLYADALGMGDVFA